MNNVLFHSENGEVTSQGLLEALKQVGAADCDILYIHTGMTFGLPAIRRKDLLPEILNVLESLGVSTLIFPTFTFSFCNEEIYDVQCSPTFMGTINEYVRKTGKGRRSLDPLLSVYVIGETLNLIDNLSKHSIGLGSTYDRLHGCNKEVKFLFLGADMRQCFTYMHYMEAIIGIPYRYNRKFVGTIVNEGIEYPNQEAILYSTYANVKLTSTPIVYNDMKSRKQLSMADVGDGQICCFKEKDSYDVMYKLLTENPLCLTDGTFDENKKDMSYNRVGRILTVK